MNLATKAGWRLAKGGRPPYLKAICSRTPSKGGRESGFLGLTWDRSFSNERNRSINDGVAPLSRC